jgi:riboflavin biosynthesis pyrimidine reductase
MYLIWPDTVKQPLDDEALVDLYRPDYAAPLLRVNFVTSVDGAVEVSGYSAGLGTPPDKKVFSMLRMYAHALMVGAGTLRREGYGAILLDKERRAWRREHGLDPYPTVVIVSGRLALDPTNPALAEAPIRPIILTHATAPPDRRTALSAVADVLAFGENTIDLPAAMAALHGRGLTQVLSEGGPHLLGALTEANLVDEVCLTVSPMLAGPGAGRITAGLPHAIRGLTLAHALFAEDTLLLRYARSA